MCPNKQLKQQLPANTQKLFAAAQLLFGNEHA